MFFAFKSLIIHDLLEERQPVLSFFYNYLPKVPDNELVVFLAHLSFSAGMELFEFLLISLMLSYTCWQQLIYMVPIPSLLQNSLM